MHAYSCAPCCKIDNSLTQVFTWETTFGKLFHFSVEHVEATEKSADILFNKIGTDVCFLFVVVLKYFTKSFNGLHKRDVTA